MFALRSSCRAAGDGNAAVALWWGELCPRAQADGRVPCAGGRVLPLRGTWAPLTSSPRSVGSDHSIGLFSPAVRPMTIAEYSGLPEPRQQTRRSVTWSS
jgi:hypothetical protein